MAEEYVELEDIKRDKLKHDIKTGIKKTGKGIYTAGRKTSKAIKSYIAGEKERFKKYKSELAVRQKESKARQLEYLKGKAERAREERKYISTKRKYQSDIDKTRKAKGGMVGGMLGSGGVSSFGGGSAFGDSMFGSTSNKGGGSFGGDMFGGGSAFGGGDMFGSPAPRRKGKKGAKRRSKKVRKGKKGKGKTITIKVG